MPNHDLYVQATYAAHPVVWNVLAAFFAIGAAVTVFVFAAVFVYAARGPGKDTSSDSDPGPIPKAHDESGLWRADRIFIAIAIISAVLLYLLYVTGRA